MKPKARDEGVTVQSAGDELVVYDHERFRVHCLNSVAAAVYRRCDGQRTERDIAQLLAAEVGPETSLDVTRLALDRLEQARLLAASGKTRGAISRRAAIRQALLAAGVAVPMITSILAPTPAEAQSSMCVTPCTGPLGCCQTGEGPSPCNPVNCCSGSCTGGCCS